ncbi:MAG: diguanylate cyclase [Spirochaetes bacterium]|nr:diguanylate cyclase [Spirochaetota bacterium]
MKKLKVLREKVGIGLLPLLPIALNLAYPTDPGLGQWYSLPYVVIILLQATLGGVLLGFLAWIAVGIGVLSVSILQGSFPPPTWADPVRVAIWGSLPLLVYIFGRITDVLRGSLRAVQSRFRVLVQKNQRDSRIIQELQKVNAVLEERVARQRDSLTLLYNQVQTIRTLNLEKALRVLLETVQMFLQARRITLWTLDETMDRLKIETSLGWEGKEREEYLPLNDSVEGWVYRNSSLFSFRMLLQYENLKKIYRGGTVLSVPVHAGKKPFGVLSIEELPFERYNLYSEKLVQIIVGLSEPFLEEILEYRQMTNLTDVDEDTGIPNYSQFYYLMTKELERARNQGSPLSVVVLEVENFSDLAQRFGKKAAKGSLKGVVEELTLFSDSRFSSFLYREEGQVVFLCPNLDQDGASLFCLESLERLNQREWKIGDTPIPISMVVGYATARVGSYEPESLLQQVDHLLLLQKM